ncbi:EamA family transporter [Taklimakanibacter deserti]|uniref:EamA family transporter n=1 Tax=Taklimakanibacter deserti TaxID=2267839 RepID=UPI000E659209
MGFAALWPAFTVIAATAQTFRNAAQKALSDELGTVGATYIRFLFGLPFGLAALALLAIAGSELPRPTVASLQWTVFGALSQIGGTALLLTAMRERSFLVTIAYTHTEPLLVALFALAFLGEQVTLSLAAAMLIAIAGVISLSWPSRAGIEIFSWRPALYGIASGALFAMAAVGFRGGITALGSSSFLSAATLTLAISLTIQTALMSCWLLLREPAILKAVFRAWRPSLAAGFLGAFASENWFLAFALTNPARVRTLGLVEILIAAFVSHRLFAQTPGLRDIIGVALILAGVALIFND